jgi:hypothetical protein
MRYKEFAYSTVLTPEQVTRIFENIDNPDVLVEGVNPQAKQQIQQSAKATAANLNKLPKGAVQKFDEKVLELERKIEQKEFTPDQISKINHYIEKYKEWGEKHPILHAAILGALGVAATMATGAAAGAAVVGFLGMVDGQLMGMTPHAAAQHGAIAGVASFALASILDWASEQPLVQNVGHWFGDVGKDVATDLGKNVMRGAAGNVAKSSSGAVAGAPPLPTTPSTPT